MIAERWPDFGGGGCTHLQSVGEGFCPFSRPAPGTALASRKSADRAGQLAVAGGRTRSL